MQDNTGGMALMDLLLFFVFCHPLSSVAEEPKVFRVPACQMPSESQPGRSDCDDRRSKIRPGAQQCLRPPSLFSQSSRERRSVGSKRGRTFKLADRMMDTRFTNVQVMFRATNTISFSSPVRDYASTCCCALCAAALGGIFIKVTKSGTTKIPHPEHSVLIPMIYHMINFPLQYAASESRYCLVAM